jgi:hypothetical protein
VELKIFHKARVRLELTDKAKQIRAEHLQTSYQIGKEYFGSS